MLKDLQRAVLFNDLLAVLFFFGGLFALAALLCGWFFVSGWFVLLAFVPVGYWAWRWLGRLRLKDIGYQVERIFPGVAGRVVTALELCDYQPGVEGYSLALRDAAVASVTAELARLPLKRVVCRRRLVVATLTAVLAATLFVAYLSFGGVRARVGLVNAFLPNRLRLNLMVSPGDTVVVPGDEVRLLCRVQPAGLFSSVKLEIVPRSAVRGLRRRVALQGDSGVFAVGVQDGFRYRFSLLGQKSGWFDVGVLKGLTLQTLTFELQPPAYSGLPVRQVQERELTVLRGTEVRVRGVVDAAIGGGRLVIGADTVPVAVEEKEAGVRNKFHARFVVRNDGELVVELRRAAGQTARDMERVVRVPVRVIGDEAPFVRLFLPGRDVDLPVSMQVLLGVHCIDDYGLGDLWLHYGRDSIDRVVRLKNLRGRREDTTFYVWDLTQAALLPGDLMRYYVRVTDNDAVSGPKSSRSEFYAVRFPTMEEIYSAAMRQTQTSQEELAPLSAQQARLGEEISRLSEELKKTRVLSWEERRKLENVLREQQELLEQVERLKQDVGQLSAEMLEGMSWDKETYARLQELQELLSRLLPERLKQALSELGRQLQMDKGQLSAALERLQKEQEELKRRLDQALELLKRIMEEERLEALARQAGELERLQRELNRHIGQDSAPALAERQGMVNAGLDSLMKEMANLAQELSEPEIAESLGTLNEQLSAAGIQELARDLQAQLQAGERRTAKEKGEELQRSLGALAERLQSLSEKMKQRRSREAVQRMLAGAEALVAISRAQEELENRLRKGAEPAGLAGEEAGLKEATRLVAESLASLGAQTLTVPPELGQELARGLNFMEEAGRALVEGRSAIGQGQMQQARRSLHRAVMLVLDAAERAAKGGGMKGGLQDLLEQLAQMTAEQMQINAGMSGLPIPIPMSGLSAQQLQQLMELLARQQALREQLERLMQSMGGERPGLTGRLEGLIDEMKVVERSLAELQVDRKLIERQEGVLARLLDAQRSIRQEGFKEERRAETAKGYRIVPVSNLSGDLGERNRRLREELLRALKQGYPPEYERLIRAYFQRLLEE